MKKEPKNYAYWKIILKDGDKVAEFMSRGTLRQKKEIKTAFKFWESQNKTVQKDLFQ
ncbi:MAG: hypothetical protein HQL29_00050 [Candidatus Omnitrophica bacterium]|nr:hypothetical protein [Candidatus Omnitrophota bacterium]